MTYPAMFQPQVVDKTPVVDLKKDATIQNTGIVTLVPINNKSNRTLQFTFTGFTGKHYKTGENMWFGDVVKVNGDGSYKFRRISITDVREYNLNNPQDAQEWHIVRHHPNVKGSPNERNPAWRVIDRYEEARTSLARGKQLSTFINRILEMSDDQVKDLGRPFNLSAEFNPPDVIRGELTKIAYTNPERLAKFLNEKDYFAAMAVLHRCLAAGKVKNEPTRGFIFNDRIYLGSSEQEAVEKMKAESDLYQQMDTASRDVLNQKTAPAAKAKEQFPEDTSGPFVSMGPLNKDDEDVMSGNDF